MSYLLMAIAVMSMANGQIAIRRGWPGWVRGLFLGLSVGAVAGWVVLNVRLLLGLP